MSDISSRMQLRVQILNMLSKYRTNKNSENPAISQDISFLKSIKDKKYVAKLLFKEISSPESNEYINACAIMALETLDKDTFEDCAINFLQNEENSDEKKFLIISLIKQKGIYFDYDEIENYIKNPVHAAEDGVKNFLLNAIYDPEAQIDLIDFYINIPENEKLYFLDNISKEEQIDSVACAMSILIQLNVEKNEFEIIKNVLIDLNSPYAIVGLEYILKNYKIDLKERQKIKNRIKKLENKYPNFTNDAIIKDSEIFDSYISFVDGNSNFSLVLSRKMKDGSIDAILLTINTVQGICACMGFGNISHSSYTTIKRRLFSDSVPNKISPMALKALFEYYKNKNKKTNTELPYELIVWENLLSDIQDINYDVSDFINSKLETVNLAENKVKQFFLSKTIDTWYWTQGQNDVIDNLIEKIENEHITDYKEINKLVLNCVAELISDKEFIAQMHGRLLLCAYVAHLAKLKITSAVAYSICFEIPYFKMFMEYLTDRSLYEYFVDIYEENIRQNSQSIFKRGKKSEFTIEELNELILSIEEKWILKKE